MLLTTSWFDKVKNVIGLKAVSQVWGNKPAWYFWISQAPGVYYFQLDEVVVDYWKSDGLATGVFSIKCYPYSHEKVFQSFSFEEQAFTQSHFFDHTHTPLYEYKEKIPGTLFNVATFALTIDSPNNLALFTYESLDYMRISYNQEMLQKYPELKREKKFEAGEKGRNVPGYELGYQLLDRILSLYSFYSKTKPLRVLLSRSPGFEYVYDTDRTFQCLDKDDININMLNVLFVKNSSKKSVKGDILIEKRLKEGGHKVVFDQRFQCGHFHNNNLSILTTPLNSQWWSLAEADYKSDRTSSCGCSADH